MAVRPQWVTFDVGGTLIVPNPPVGEVYAAALAEHGVQVNPDTVEQRFRKAFKHHTAQQRERIDEAAEKAFWRQIVQDSFAGDCPPDKLDMVFEAVFAHFAQGVAWRVFADVRPALDSLHNAGFRLAALSNSDARFHRVLRELELTPFFAHVLLSSELGCEKPSANFFARAQDTFGTFPEDILHIGDSRRHDYEGARAAGWRALHLDRQGASSGTDSVSSLTEAAEYCVQGS